MQKLIEAVGTFLRETIWLERRSARWAVTSSTKLLRVCVLVGKGFYDDKCFLRASGLAFTTVLSLVPLMAFAFSVLKGFGAEQYARDAVIEYVTVGQEELGDMLKGYVEKVGDYVRDTKVTSLAALSLIILLWTVLKVLGTVERSFNEIWGVRRGRSWLRKLADYTSVVVIAPVLLAFAMGISAYLSAGAPSEAGGPVALGAYLALFGVWLGRNVLTWVAFACLYAFMPNTRVRFAAALTGGLAAGILWQAAFWTYTTSQMLVGKYNYIYGSFAAVPIFLGWLYLSWVITLFGAEVAFAYEHVETYRQRLQRFEPSPAARERIALRVFLEIAGAFHSGAPPPDPERVSSALNVPVRAIHEITGVLCAVGLVSNVEVEGGTAYQPARELSRITPGDVLAAVRAHGEDLHISKKDWLWQETLELAGGFEGKLGEDALSSSIAGILSKNE